MQENVPSILIVVQLDTSERSSTYDMQLKTYVSPLAAVVIKVAQLLALWSGNRFVESPRNCVCAQKAMFPEWPEGNLSTWWIWRNLTKRVGYAV